MSYIDDLNDKKADINVFYKTVGDLKLPLQVFLPSDFDETKKYKTVIAIHGGGWYSLKETPVDWDGGWMANNVKYYTQKGYVGIVFSYRDIEFEANSDIGYLLKDCYDAMKYIADSFSFLDNKNILLMGDSSGGHLALCLGMSLPDGIKPAIIPSKIVVYNPITNCVKEKRKCCADDVIRYSPVHNIKSINSEVLIMHGTADTVVDIEDSRVFKEKLEAVGNNVSIIEIPGANHAFIIFGYLAQEEDVLKALELTDKHFNL